MKPEDRLTDALIAADPARGRTSSDDRETFRRVDQRIRAANTGRRRPHATTPTRQPRRGAGLFLPGMTVAVSLAVIAVLIVAVFAGPHRGPGSVSGTQHSPPAGSTGTPSAPPSGMPGYVTVWGAAFNAQGDGAISLLQCLRCRPDGNGARTSAYRFWLASTRDGAEHWSLSPENYYLTDPILTGQSGWSTGMRALTRSQITQKPVLAQPEPGETSPTFYTSHDGGQSWSVGPRLIQNDLAPASVQDHEVWIVGDIDPLTILRGPARSGRLVVTSSQPDLGSNDSNVQIAAAGAQTAYVVDPQVLSQAFATDNGGATWTRISTPPCTGRIPYAELDAAYHQTVWLTCTAVGRPATLVRSTSGGRSWTSISTRWANGPRDFTAVSARVVWTITSDGTVLRSTDAGDSWRTVWSLDDVEAHPLSGPISLSRPGALPALSVQSASSATIVTLLNHDTAKTAAHLTDLVTYRTDDGGRTWKTAVVPLSPSH